MGYRRFRRPLTLVARRPSLVARRRSWGPSTSGKEKSGRAESHCVSESHYAYLYYLLTILTLLTYPTESVVG